MHMPNTLSIRAYHIAQAIDLAEAEKKMGLEPAWRTRHFVRFALAPEQWLWVFTFGVIVLLGLPEKEEKKIAKKLGKALTNPAEKFTEETYSVVIDTAATKDDVQFESVTVKRLASAKMELIALALAQSAAIEAYDVKADEIVSSLEVMNQELAAGGKLNARIRTLSRTLGQNQLILQSILSRIALLDKPDIVWDSAELETLYGNLRSMFELEDRFRIIEVKVDYITKNSSLLLGLLQNRRGDLLELTIIGLILFEIIFLIYEFLVK